jgi:hypothetical protein
LVKIITLDKNFCQTIVHRIEIMKTQPPFFNVASLFSFLLLAFVVPSSVAQSLHGQVFDAQTAIYQKNWNAAETLLNRENQTQPNNPHVLYELAQVYENTGREDRAYSIYEAFSKMPLTAQLQTLVLIRSADGARISNLAQLTASGLERTASKRPPALPAAAVLVASPAPTPSITPALAPAPLAPAPLDPAQVIALKKWATAWANKDMTTYFASYVSGFKGETASSEIWKNQRSKAISNKKMIEIDLSNIETTELSPTSSKVAFQQDYSADSLKDTSNKVLLMRKVGDSWLIERESKQK